jgi:hypothetical protein
LNQSAEFVIEMGYFGGSAVKYRISLDADWSDGHRLNLPEASAAEGRW